MAIRDFWKRTAYRGQRDGRAIVGRSCERLTADDPEAFRMARAVRQSIQAGREFYGPGAEAANARRAERMRPEGAEEPKPAVPAAAVTAQPQSRRDRKDLAKAAKLQARIDALKKRLEGLGK